MSYLPTSWWALLFGALAPLPLLADEVDVRHGSVEAPPQTRVEAGYTAVAQGSDESRLTDNLLASVDLVLTRRQGRGRWTLYIEGNSNVPGNGLTTAVPDVNGDALSAVDASDRGRLQVSELHYRWEDSNDELLGGLIGPNGYLDHSEVAGNETAQFLATAFTHNPVIAHPDYTLGALWHHQARSGRPGFTLLLAASNGLHDNPRRSYDELFELDAAGKGVFAALEGYRLGNRTLTRLGAWVNGARFARLDGQGTAPAYGLYLNADYYGGAINANLRVGLANPAVGRGAAFAGVAAEHPVGTTRVGLALGYTWRSADDPTPASGDIAQAEFYWALPLGDGLALSPDLQWLRNGGFDASGAIYRRDLWVAGLRLNQTL